ncbi:Xylose isomerase [Pseudomonas extremaustralis]|nr:Xylose isomerase [Pseudomonas extremaustralis]
MCCGAVARAETLLNTDLKREREQLGRFMRMVVEHKHKIGFKGDLLIEPKPQEPTKHQYDYDSATVFGFLHEYGLEHEIKVNIEANHATLAGHSFHHEIATAVSWASSAASTPTAATRRTAGTPTSSPTASRK